MSQEVLFCYILLVGAFIGWQLCLLNMKLVLWLIKRKLSKQDWAKLARLRAEMRALVLGGKRK